MRSNTLKFNESNEVRDYQHNEDDDMDNFEQPSECFESNDGTKR